MSKQFDFSDPKGQRNPVLSSFPEEVIIVNLNENAVQIFIAGAHKDILLSKPLINVHYLKKSTAWKELSRHC